MKKPTARRKPAAGCGTNNPLSLPFRSRAEWPSGAACVRAHADDVPKRLMASFAANRHTGTGCLSKIGRWVQSMPETGGNWRQCA